MPTMCCTLCTALHLRLMSRQLLVAACISRWNAKQSTLWITIDCNKQTLDTARFDQEITSSNSICWVKHPNRSKFTTFSQFFFVFKTNFPFFFFKTNFLEEFLKSQSKFLLLQSKFFFLKNKFLLLQSKFLLLKNKCLFLLLPKSKFFFNSNQIVSCSIDQSTQFTNYKHDLLFPSQNLAHQTRYLYFVLFYFHFFHKTPHKIRTPKKAN